MIQKLLSTTTTTTTTGPLAPQKANEGQRGTTKANEGWELGNGKGLGQFCSKFSLKFLKNFEAIIIPIYINSFGLTFFVETL